MGTSKNQAATRRNAGFRCVENGVFGSPHMDQNALYNEIILLLGTVAFVTASFRKAGLNPILGLMAAGVVLGPHGFGALPERDHLDTLSGMGIMFLLFLVGLELSPARIRTMARAIFGLGKPPTSCCRGGC